MLDASAAADMLMWPEANRQTVRSLLGETVQVPAHFDAEVFAAVRRALLRGRIAGAGAERALLEAARLPAQRVPLAGLLAEAYALRDRFSPGDVFYVVVARRSAATLLTSDASLARAAGDYTRVRLAVPASDEPPSGPSAPASPS